MGLSAGRNRWSASSVLTGLEQAPEWVRARKAEGSDWIKIIYEDGSASGMEIPSLDGETVAALAAAAHAEGLAAVVHVRTLEQALEAMAFGADGLVHPCGATRSSPRRTLGASRRRTSSWCRRSRSWSPPWTPPWRNWCRRRTKRYSHRFSGRHSPIASRVASRRAEKWRWRTSGGCVWPECGWSRARPHRTREPGRESPCMESCVCSRAPAWGARRRWRRRLRWRQTRLASQTAAGSPKAISPTWSWCAATSRKTCRAATINRRDLEGWVPGGARRRLRRGRASGRDYARPRGNAGP